MRSYECRSRCGPKWLKTGCIAEFVGRLRGSLRAFSCADHFKHLFPPRPRWGMATIDRLYFVITHTSSEHRISDVLCKGNHRSFQHIACSPWIILPDQHVYVRLSVADQRRSANNQQVDGSYCLHDINSVRTQHNQLMHG